MSRRVFVHIGLPKTGTSYLQAIAWPGRDAAARRRPAAAGGAQERPPLELADRARRPGRRPPWSRCRRGVGPGAAPTRPGGRGRRAGQPRVLLRGLGGAGGSGWSSSSPPPRCTSSSPPASRWGCFTSSWQESLKNKSTTRLADYGRTESDDPRDVWDWRSLDLGLVLDRWAPAVPPERLHVITPPPPGSAREVLWERFCRRARHRTRRPATRRAASPTPRWGWSRRRRCAGSTSGSRASTTRGPAACGSARSWPTSGWCRGVASRSGRPPTRSRTPGPRGARAVASGCAPRRTTWSATSTCCCVPDDLPPRRHPDSVTDAEVADVALDLVADADGRPAASRRPHERSRRTRRRG